MKTVKRRESEGKRGKEGGKESRMEGDREDAGDGRRNMKARRDADEGKEREGERKTGGEGNGESKGEGVREKKREGITPLHCFGCRCNNRWKTVQQHGQIQSGKHRLYLRLKSSMVAGVCVSVFV